MILYVKNDRSILNVHLYKDKTFLQHNPEHVLTVTQQLHFYDSCRKTYTQGLQTYSS